MCLDQVCFYHNELVRFLNTSFAITTKSLMVFAALLLLPTVLHVIPETQNDEDFESYVCLPPYVHAAGLYWFQSGCIWSR